MLNILLITWALFAGIIMARALNIFKLPNVTAYLIAGVLIGPSILGRLSIEGIGFNNFEEVHRITIISDVALGFIAFANGHEFKLHNLRNFGKQVFTIGILQAVIATICVDIVLVVLHFVIPDIVTLPMAITLGAIAAATAPASTLMVVKQYNAKGPVADILLPIVAINDAVGLVIFSISFGVAGAMVSGNASILNILVEPVLEITLSLILGAIVAVVLTFIVNRLNTKSSQLMMIITSIILIVAIAKLSLKVGEFGISFSPLLSCMMLGAVFCNMYKYSDELMDDTYNWSQPVLVLFFVLSGAELNLSVFTNIIVVMVGLAYIFARTFGKYFGAKFSATIAGSNNVVRKYLGIALLPQAGVALGMSAIAANAFGENGLLIRNITLFGVLIYELVGPTFTKMALIKAGDIKSKL